MPMFVCPICKAQVIRKDGSFLCSRCAKQWPLTDGIADFRISRERYWGEYPQDVMDQLASRCQEIGWELTLQEFFRDKDPGYLDYITDKNRANWVFCLPLPKEARILDAGCGWGALSFKLAKSYQEVFALDTVPQRLRFLEKRKQEEGAENISCVCGQINYLPFPDDFFDLVVLNGVLEWVPSIETQMDPYHSQVGALKEVHRVLKKGGFLYLAIENRWAAINFLGFKDTHSGLRFAPLLPRSLAGIYSRMVRRKDFREYTYTYGEHKKILKNTGFPKPVFYAPLPSYRRFQYLVPVEDRLRVSFFLKHLVLARKNLQIFFVRLARGARLYRFIKYFVPDFSIIARKDGAAVIPKNILHNSRERVTLFVFKDGDFFPEHIMKIYDRAWQERIEGQIAWGKKINLCEHRALKDSIPRLLRYQITDEHCIVCEEYVRGLSMRHDAERSGLFWKRDFKDDLSLAAEWLSSFHKNFPSGRAVISRQDISVLFKDVGKFLKTDFIHPGAQDLEVPTVVAHGDFRPDNIIRDGARLAVLDWDRFDPRGLPLLDLLTFVLRYFHAHHRMQKEKIYLEPEIFLKYFRAFYAGNTRICGIVKDEVNRYCTALGLNEAQRDALLLVWLRSVFYPEKKRYAAV